MHRRRQVKENSSILMGCYELPPFLHLVAFQGVEHPKYREPSYYPIKMVEENERTYGPNSVWGQLDRNKAVAVMKLTEEGMKGLSENCMEKSLI